MKERNISEEWLEETIKYPEWQEVGQDGNTHCFKSISEYENRILHVVINKKVSPNKIVTVYFDRRAREK